MRFKKIYIEITNSCNLKCDFCVGTRRMIKFMSFDEFKLVLFKIKSYTNYLYFHILGEPLLHPDIIKFIDYAGSCGFFVNITTNGYLINKLIGVRGIRQLNISLHSFNSKYGISYYEYMNNIFSVIDNFDNTYVSLRFWTDINDDLFNFIKKHYNISSLPSNFDGFKLKKNIFLSKSNEFIWPDFNNDFYNEKGKCYGLIDHIGILCDGSIVPCCLDSNGSILLGNIFSDSLEDILSSSRVSSMIHGFKCGIRYEEFCKHCGFFVKEKKEI